MPRARDIGVVIGQGKPGPHNAITDIPGISVGFATLISGSDVRTGVTVVLPFDGRQGLFAGFHRLNGNGEMTGTHYIREMGMLTSPIAIANTHAVGAVHEGLIAASVESDEWAGPFTPWALPVVAETYDGALNDINGFHVRPEHARQALRAAQGGPVDEGNVGGGTGMICHGFKGGTGTASRVLDDADGGFTVGVLVQANHGQRRRLTIAGMPVGERIPVSIVPAPGPLQSGQGSIIVVIATDGPLLPGQCDRLAQRASLGIGRMGGLGEDSSGDLILAFSVANRFPPARDGQPPPITSVSMLPNQRMNPLFEAVVEATEEAILNALLAAETMTGRGGNTALRLPPDLLLGAMGAR